MPILDAETGDSLKYRQLCRNTKHQNIWEYYCNELVRLYQCVGTGDKYPKKQRVAGTDTFHVIRYEDVLVDRRKEVTYKKVVCEVHPPKYDPSRTWITISGNRIIYPGDVETPTASIKVVNLIINTVISLDGARFYWFNVKYYNLYTLLNI